MQDATVYESSTKTKASRRPGSRVRFRLFGVWHVQSMEAGRLITSISCGGKHYRIANVQLPVRGGDYIAHPLDGLCEQCGSIYSHLMTGAKQPCNECHTEDLAERARVLEEQGIPLGWGHHVDDDVDPAWQYECYARPKRKLGQRWDMNGYWQDGRSESTNKSDRS